MSKRQYVSKESIEWHKDVLRLTLDMARARFDTGSAIDAVVRRRLERLERFLSGHFSDVGLPYEKKPFDPVDAVALIVWPRWKALKLAKRMFHLRTASQLKIESKEREDDLLSQMVDDVNLDWFDFDDRTV